MSSTSASSHIRRYFASEGFPCPAALSSRWSILTVCWRRCTFAMISSDVAVLCFHDGNAGQIETWFEQVTGHRIACFVYEAAGPFDMDIEAEHRRRVSQRTEFPQHGMFKGRPFIVSLDWVAELKKYGIRKVLPLTPENRERLEQIDRKSTRLNSSHNSISS